MAAACGITLQHTGLCCVLREHAHGWSRTGSCSLLHRLNDDLSVHSTTAAPSALMLHHPSSSQGMPLRAVQDTNVPQSMKGTSLPVLLKCHQQQPPSRGLNAPGLHNTHGFRALCCSLTSAVIPTAPNGVLLPPPQLCGISHHRHSAHSKSQTQKSVPAGTGWTQITES